MYRYREYIITRGGTINIPIDVTSGMLLTACSKGAFNDILTRVVQEFNPKYYLCPQIQDAAEVLAQADPRPEWKLAAFALRSIVEFEVCTSLKSQMRHLTFDNTSNPSRARTRALKRVCAAFGVPCTLPRKSK